MAQTKAQAKKKIAKRRAAQKKKKTATQLAAKKERQKKRIRRKAADKAAGIKPRAVESLFGEGAMGAKPMEHRKKTKRSVGY
jgi:membrane protein involved in colicin uptake